MKDTEIFVYRDGHTADPEFNFTWHDAGRVAMCIREAQAGGKKSMTIFDWP